MTIKLTDREKEVLEALAQGLSRQGVADALGISTRTVDFHTQHIYGKLEVNDKTNAILKARKLGLMK